MGFTNWIRSKSTDTVVPTIKIEDFPEMFSDKIIGVILQEEKDTSNTYIGGDFHINYIDNERYSCSYELYFKDKSEQIYKMTAESKPVSNAKLVPEAREEISKEKNITFEIPEPTAEERKNFKEFTRLADIFDFLSSLGNGKK